MYILKINILSHIKGHRPTVFYEYNEDQYKVISNITVLLRFTYILKLNIKLYQIAPPYRVLYTGCPGRNVPNFGRVFLMLNYTDITQNTYIQS